MSSAQLNAHARQLLVSVNEILHIRGGKTLQHTKHVIKGSLKEAGVGAQMLA